MHLTETLRRLTIEIQISVTLFWSIINVQYGHQYGKDEFTSFSMQVASGY